MSQLTITEALAEITTIDKRLDKKREYVVNNAARVSVLKDALEKHGGSEQVVKQEIQSYEDLLERKVRLREAINKANRDTQITLAGFTRSIAEWLIWRRESSSKRKQLLNALSSQINRVRKDAEGKTYGEEKVDIISHVDEAWLASEIERMEQIEGQLDGILSLKNATVTVEI